MASDKLTIWLLGAIFAVAMLFLSSILARDQAEIDRLTNLLTTESQQSASQLARLQADEKEIDLLQAQASSVDRRVQAIEIGTGQRPVGLR